MLNSYIQKRTKNILENLTDSLRDGEYTVNEILSAVSYIMHYYKMDDQ